jgi:hypothetical protein
MNNRDIKEKGSFRACNVHIWSLASKVAFLEHHEIQTSAATVENIQYTVVANSDCAAASLGA